MVEAGGGWGGGGGQRVIPRNKRVMQKVSMSYGEISVSHGATSVIPSGPQAVLTTNANATYHTANKPCML